MIPFQPLRLDPVRCEVELDDLAQLLRAHAALPERAAILPFFRQRPQLLLLLGLTYGRVNDPDCFAQELRLFGSFVADAVVGEWDRRSFCLVEFEEGAPESTFVHGRRGTSLWSPRFEHGFSQIVDRLWKLDDLRGTSSFMEVFGAATIDVVAVLVVGRDAGLTLTDRERLTWRRRHVLVNSQYIYCCTYDELERDLRQRLTLFSTRRPSS
jgi:hypothetical protein